MRGSIVPSQQPVVDVKSCEAWLARAALADARQACRELTGLVESFEETPPPAGALVDILERLREPIFVAQAEHAKRFSGRPLPLKDFENTSFEEAHDLWTGLGRAYRGLLRRAVEARPSELRGREALLAHRAIDCVGELMLAHYRARREIDDALWGTLHQLYRTAELEGVGLTTVSAGYRSKSVSTCNEAYIRALLLSLANPYSLGSREIAWTRRWATMWAYKVDLVSGGGDIQGYAVDLAGHAPPAWMTAQDAAPTTRFLDPASLRRSIRSRVKKLDEGIDPQTLGLGKDCVLPDVGRLLIQLLRAWIEMPAPRQFTRRHAVARTELVCGVEAIHAAVTGKAFKGAVRHWDYSRRDAEQIHIYQGVGPAATPAEGPAPVAPEKWETLDESANGFRLRRKAPGERLSLGQLIALRPEDGRAFILSDVRWLMTGIDGALTIGAAALPGLAKGVAVRSAAAPNETAEPYKQAFLLPNSAAQPTSLVLPSGWFQAGRELEVRGDDDTLAKVKIVALAHRGYDYDRVSFSVVGTVSA